MALLGPISLADGWPFLLMRGIIALVLAVIAVAVPAITITALTLAVAAYLFADGMVALVVGFRARHNGRRVWPIAAEGALNWSAAAAIVVWPGFSLLAFIAFAALWAMVSGLLFAAAAGQMPDRRGNVIMLATGLISVLFGILLVVRPVDGLIALIWLLASYALVFGAAMIATALRLRTLLTAS